MLAPCWAQAQDDIAFPRARVEAVLATALGAVLERHIERASVPDLALWSLRGLEVLEPRLQPELQGSVVVLTTSDDRRLAAHPLPDPLPGGPPEDAAPALAHVLADLFEISWRVSPTLRQAGPERMLRSAFEELFDHLDPYSRYLTPAEALAARIRRVGQAGLGLELGAGGRGNRDVVVAALEPGRPAATSGVRRGDRVLAVDGVPVSARDFGFAASLLEGPAETEVELRLERGGKRRSVLLRRRVAPVPSVRSEARDGVLWVRIEAFTDSTDGRLAEAVLAAAASGATRGLVLDLRGNRGGLLSQAVSVAGAFLAGGTVAWTSGRHPDAARVWEAPGPDLAEGLPLVVLVDGRTASAAEIVAAALGERGRAVVVGSATTGKGLIQAVVPLPNGGELLVTWSQVFGPGGWPIQGVGVMPAVCTSVGADALAEDAARLRRGEPPNARPVARLLALRPPSPQAPQPFGGIAGLRATCPPAEGKDADATVARLLLDGPAGYAAALIP